jgi:hypothetical protein
MKTHSTFHITAKNRSQVKERFAAFAKKLYESKGYLDYPDEKSFRLFEYSKNQYGYPVVKVGDLGYFAWSDGPVAEFIQVLQDLMKFVIHNKSKQEDRPVKDIVEIYLVIEEPYSINIDAFKL